jgi:hypothetical protein
VNVVACDVLGCMAAAEWKSIGPPEGLLEEFVCETHFAVMYLNHPDAFWKYARLECEPALAVVGTAESALTGRVEPSQNRLATPTALVA